MRASAVILLSALVCSIATRSWAQPSLQKESFLLTDTEAIGVLPADMAASGEVESAKWSSDGRYALIFRTVFRLSPNQLKGYLSQSLNIAPGETVITVWDNKARQSQDVWKRPFGGGRIMRVEWLPGTAIALVMVETLESPTEPGGRPRSHFGVLRVNAATGISKPLVDDAQGDAWQLEVSPVLPLSLIRYMERPVAGTVAPGGARVRAPAQEGLLLLRDDGNIGKRIPLPSGLFLYEVVWAADGSPILRTAARGQPGSNVVRKSYTMEPRTGLTSEVSPEPPLFAKPPDAVSVRLKNTSVEVSEKGAAHKVPFLWLESAVPSERPVTLVAPNASMGAISPGGDAILYRSNGAAWVAPLMRLTKSEYARLIGQIERTGAIEKAKQLASALQKYAVDNNDTLPSAGTDVNDSISPYLKMSGVFEGFSYTFRGGPLSGVNSPGTTEMGFVTGPGGRAVIFVDGHVTWRSD